MKKSTLLAVALLLLAACASYPPMSTSPHNPSVRVVSGIIVVGEDPIVIGRDEKGEVRITWQLTPGSPYTFPEDGIVVAKGSDKFHCRREAERQVFTCNHVHSGPARYKYTIKVEGPDHPEPFDPTIMDL